MRAKKERTERAAVSDMARRARLTGSSGVDSGHAPIPNLSLTLLRCNAELSHSSRIARPNCGANDAERIWGGVSACQLRGGNDQGRRPLPRRLQVVCIDLDERTHTHKRWQSRRKRTLLLRWRQPVPSRPDRRSGGARN